MMEPLCEMRVVCEAQRRCCEFFGPQKLLRASAALVSHLAHITNCTKLRHEVETCNPHISANPFWPIPVELMNKTTTENAVALFDHAYQEKVQHARWQSLCAFSVSTAL